METHMAFLTKVTNSQYNRGQHIPNQREGTGQLKKGDDNLDQKNAPSLEIGKPLCGYCLSLSFLANWILPEATTLTTMEVQISQTLLGVSY